VYTTDTNGPFVGHLRRICSGKVVIQDPRPVPGEYCHISDHLLRTIESMDIVAGGSRYPSIPAEAVEASYARDFFCGTDIDRLALLHPGSGGPSKRWPLDRFLDLADWLRAQGHPVGVLTGPAEEEEFEETCGNSGFVAVRPPNLNALAGVLASASLYIGNDSGPTHLAAALGVPTVALFGPTDPRIWGPRGRRVLLVTARTDDITSLTLADVVVATERILGGEDQEG
jgi:ADP-heptose:LPS heptosyltransferase